MGIWLNAIDILGRNLSVVQIADLIMQLIHEKY